MKNDRLNKLVKKMFCRTTFLKPDTDAHDGTEIYMLRGFAVKGNQRELWPCFRTERLGSPEAALFVKTHSIAGK